MKKLIYIAVSMLFLSANAKDYSVFCSSTTPPKTVSGAFMSTLGINSVSRNIIEKQIEKTLKKETNSKFKVKINNFYATNILSGQFQSLSAKSDLFSYDGLYLSDLNVNTICPYNKVSYRDDKLLFDENMVLSYFAKITQSELDKIVSSAEFQKIIRDLNNDETISSIMQIKSAKVILKDNKLYFKYGILFNGFGFFKTRKNMLNLVFSADLKVAEGQVKICNFSLNSKTFNNNMFLPVINKFNPTNWKIDIDKDNEGELEVKEVKIENSTIFLSGIILIKKS